VRRRLLVVGALVAVAALTAGALGVALRVGDGTDAVGPPAAAATELAGGPLASPPGTRSNGAFPVELGRPYSWGEVLLRNEGRLAVTLDAIELIRASPDLVILDVRVVRPTSGLIGFLAGWERSGVEPEGTLVGAGRTNERELVVGLRVDAAGRYRIDGVRVRYHDALQRYVATFDQAIVLCAPAARYTTEERCRGG
jgi:hypothetical protein